MRFCVLVLMLAACGDDPLCGSGKVADQLTLANAGMTVVVTTSPYSLEIRDAAGNTVLAGAGAGSGDGYGTLGWTTGVAGIDRFVDQGYFSFGANLDPWRDHGKVVSATQGTDRIDVVVETGDGCVSISHVLRDGALRVEAHRTRPTGQPRAWEVAFATPADEAFLGLGERYDRVDHRGMALYNLPEEGGLTEGESVPESPGNPFPNGPTMTYYPVPFFLSTQGYGFWLDTTWRNEFDFASDRPDAWRAWHIGPDLAFEVYVGTPLADPRHVHRGDRPADDPARVELRAAAADQPRRDDRQRVGAAGDARRRSRDHRRRRHDCTSCPTASISATRTSYARGSRVRRALGYKMIGYYNPYFSASPTSPLASVTQEGIANHYFLGDASGTPGTVTLISGALLDVYTVDVTNADAVAWFTAQFKRALDLGYSGWMYDFGEYVQPAWVAHDGETGMELHDHFPVLYDKAAHDALEAARSGRLVLLLSLGLHRLAAVRADDLVGRSRRVVRSARGSAGAGARGDHAVDGGRRPLSAATSAASSACTTRPTPRTASCSRAGSRPAR